MSRTGKRYGNFTYGEYPSPCHRLAYGNFACGEYSRAQPLVSELPDGFGGECEPESKARRALGGR